MKQKIDIAQCIEQNLKQYFKDLNGETPCAVYEMVLNQVRCSAALWKNAAATSRKPPPYWG